jgi:hypothetical protein
VSGLAAALLATGLKLVASHAYPDGAPAGFSGGFKEDSCQACHFSQELNAAPGRVAIEGAPARYEAGRKYTVTISLTRADMKLAGFQLAARFKDGGGQAGSLAPGPGDAERIDIAREGTVQYANQKKAGSALTEAGIARWSIEWTAPASGGVVVFAVAANGADGDGTTGGDYVYTATAESAPAAIIAAALRASRDAGQHRRHNVIAARP